MYLYALDTCGGNYVFPITVTGDLPAQHYAVELMVYDLFLVPVLPSKKLLKFTNPFLSHLILKDICEKICLLKQRNFKTGFDKKGCSPPS